MANKHIRIFNLPPVTFSRPILIRTSYVDNIHEALNEISKILEEKVPPPSRDRVYLLASALYLRSIDLSLDIRVWKYPDNNYYITASAANIGDAEPSEVVYEVLEVSRIMADYNIEEHRRSGAPVQHIVGSSGEVLETILGILRGEVPPRSSGPAEGSVTGEVRIVYEGGVESIGAREDGTTTLTSTIVSGPGSGSCVEDLWRSCMSGGCVVRGEEIIVYGSRLKLVRGSGKRYTCIYDDESGSCKNIEVVLREDGSEESNCIN